MCSKIWMLELALSDIIIEIPFNYPLIQAVVLLRELQSQFSL